MTYNEAKSKLQDYKNMNFTKFVLEGLLKVEKVFDDYMNNFDDKIIYMNLKQAIYDLTIEMKAETAIGELSPRMNLELKDFLWKLILVERDGK